MTSNHKVAGSSPALGKVWMPERSKGLHLSCNIFGCVGSNPTPDKLSAWRNWIARKTSNLKVVGSSPTVDFLSLYTTINMF